MRIMAEMAILAILTNNGDTFISCANPKIPLTVFTEGAYVIVDNRVRDGWVMVVVLEWISAKVCFVDTVAIRTQPKYILVVEIDVADIRIIQSPTTGRISLMMLGLTCGNERFG